MVEAVSSRGSIAHRDGRTEQGALGNAHPPSPWPRRVNNSRAMTKNR